MDNSLRGPDQPNSANMKSTWQLIASPKAANFPEWFTEWYDGGRTVRKRDDAHTTAYQTRAKTDTFAVKEICSASWPQIHIFHWQSCSRQRWGLLWLPWPLRGCGQSVFAAETQRDQECNL